MAVDPQLGYDPGDQFHYSRGLVEELLPMALEGPELPVVGLSEGGKSVADPATGGNIQAMILDVRRALRILRHVHPGAVGAAYAGYPESAYPDWLLDEIVDVLGGPA